MVEMLDAVEDLHLGRVPHLASVGRLHPAVAEAAQRRVPLHVLLCAFDEGGERAISLSVALARYVHLTPGITANGKQRGACRACDDSAPPVAALRAGAVDNTSLPPEIRQQATCLSPMAKRELGRRWRRSVGDNEVPCSHIPRAAIHGCGGRPGS